MRIGLKNFLLLLVITILTTCSSVSNTAGSSANYDDFVISALGGIGRTETTASGPMYTGDGGGNIYLAILAPEVQGNVPDYLPLYIQGLLNNNVNKFSGINLIDRQNLNSIIAEQNLTASGRFSDKDFVRIGNLTNAQYFLFGTIQSLSGNRYSLQLSITESSTGVRRANSMKDGALTQFEGRGTLLNEATVELLEQMGVQLTEAGRQSLLAGNISAVQAEAGLARGITAQAGGMEVEALFNYAQAITFNPSQLEALSRLNTLSTTISGGTISQQIMNDIQARDQWLEVFKQTTQFFNDHPPFEIIFDPNLIQIGDTDYARRTATIGMRIVLDPSEAGFVALNALLEGLERTGRRSTWGFSGWPLVDISPRTAGTVLFSGTRTFSCKVDVALLNENIKTIGNSSINLNTGMMRSIDGTVTPPNSIVEIVNFANVKVDDLTPSLTIVIVAVNGISSRDLSTSGYMKIETGDTVRDNPVGHSDSVTSVAFSPDGSQILSGSSDRTIKLWDAATGREIRAFSGHSGIVWSVAFNPDGRQVLSIALGDTIKLWDAVTGREIRTFSHPSTVWSVAFSPDGRQVLSGTFIKTIILWDVVTGREIRTFSDPSTVWSVAFSPDGRQILSGSQVRTIKLWDVDTGREIRTFSGHSDSVRSVMFSPDGRQILSGSEDRTIKLWDTTTGREIRTLSGHSGTIDSVVFSPDGRRILSGSRDRTIKLWDAATGREIRTLSGHSDTVCSVAFSSDGRRILSGSQDRTIKLWDAETGRLIITLGTAVAR